MSELNGRISNHDAVPQGDTICIVVGTHFTPVFLQVFPIATIESGIRSDSDT
jgi:hypothetical protein